jgi:hypothetical protein
VFLIMEEPSVKVCNGTFAFSPPSIVTSMFGESNLGSSLSAYHWFVRYLSFSANTGLSFWYLPF